MVRHFLGALFWSFIGLVVFVNLFQFSGAELPFEMPWGEYELPPDSVFGFTSIFNFMHTLADDELVNTGLSWIRTGSSLIKQFTVDEVVSMFVNVRNAPDGLNWLMLLASILTILVFGLIYPLIDFVAVFIILLGVLMFLWQIVSIFLKFLLGYYNYVPISSSSNDWDSMVESWNDWWSQSSELIRIYISPIIYRFREIAVLSVLA